MEDQCGDVQKGHEPFQWLILDHAFSPELVRASAAEWPLVPLDAWHTYTDGKKGMKHRSCLPPACQLLISKMACLSLDGMFGDEGLFPDLTLHGAGLHEIPNGAQLGLHLDSDHHPTLQWTREVSGVLFLNEEWSSAWGGQLGFSDEQGQEVKKWITPKFNRLVLFRCQGTAWHQVQKVQCPLEHSRKTLAMFWWSHRPSQGERSTALFRSPVSSAEEKPY